MSYSSTSGDEYDFDKEKARMVLLPSWRFNNGQRTNKTEGIIQNQSGTAVRKVPVCNKPLGKGVGKSRLPAIHDSMKPGVNVRNVAETENIAKCKTILGTHRAAKMDRNVKEHSEMAQSVSQVQKFEKQNLDSKLVKDVTEVVHGSKVSNLPRQNMKNRKERTVHNISKSQVFVHPSVEYNNVSQESGIFMSPLDNTSSAGKNFNGETSTPAAKTKKNFTSTPSIKRLVVPVADSFGFDSLLSEPSIFLSPVKPSKASKDFTSHNPFEDYSSATKCHKKEQTCYDLDSSIPWKSGEFCKNIPSGEESLKLSSKKRKAKVIETSSANHGSCTVKRKHGDDDALLATKSTKNNSLVDPTRRSLAQPIQVKRKQPDHPRGTVCQNTSKLRRGKNKLPVIPLLHPTSYFADFLKKL